MNTARAWAAAILLSFSFTALAQQGESVGQKIKGSATEAKQAIKRDVATVKRKVRRDAAAVRAKANRDKAAVRRKAAIAQCNDGVYSYTRRGTCNQHGGIRKRLR